MDRLDAALDLMRRLPPKDLEINLKSLVQIAPDLEEELLGAVDQPLVSKIDAQTNREYLICDYNRDASSYRSPWSNEYDPPLADGMLPSARLRELEILANDAFETYKELYYESGVSSVYLWDLEEGFAATVLIKKSNLLDFSHFTGESGIGSWDSIHVLQISQFEGKSAHYQLTSTILLDLDTCAQDVGTFDLSGSMTRQAEQEFPLDNWKSHIVNIGRFVEDMESKMRHSIQDIYFGKTKDIIGELRSLTDLEEAKKQAAIQSELAAKLANRRQK